MLGFSDVLVVLSPLVHSFVTRVYDEGMQRQRNSPVHVLQVTARLQHVRMKSRMDHAWDGSSCQSQQDAIIVGNVHTGSARLGPPHEIRSMPIFVRRHMYGDES